MSKKEVLFEELAGSEGALGIITLNRVAALNALNYSMILALLAQLQDWAAAPHIKAVIIRSAGGRAFCAGGDLREAYDAMQKNDLSGRFFFREEYKLNHFIFHFPKPYIALLDGVTMGGGVGIAIHGSHRVATEQLLFAMPETGIGFFPDVGGTYFLPRLPKKQGYYLGLTGARLGCDDCLALGLVDLKVKTESLEAIIAALAKETFSINANQAVLAVLQRFAVEQLSQAENVTDTLIESCFSGTTIEQILQLLDDRKEEAWCIKTKQSLMLKSPLSLKITLQALQKGATLDFEKCMQLEYQLACQFLAGKDFKEGIRAQLIDKDYSPHWHPDTLAAITPEQVASYFVPSSERLQFRKSQLFNSAW